MKENLALTLTKFGTVDKALELIAIKPKNLLKDEVRIKMKQAAINPSDINIIEGRYGLLPNLPSALGIDGFGVIEEIGSSVTRVKKGTRVITPKLIGAFSTERIVHEKDVIPLPSYITDDQAALISINPMSAYLMLKKAYTEGLNGYLIQNAANSAVGISVISFAKYFGLKTINIVRNKEYIETLKKQGADIVITEEQLYSRQFQAEAKNLNIQIGLNAVSGKNGRYLARCLSKEATLISYGAMSKEPFTIDNGPLIFNEIKVIGFWRKLQTENLTKDAINEAYNQLFELYKMFPVLIPIDASFSLADYKEAFKKSAQSQRKGKVVFHFQK